MHKRILFIFVALVSLVCLSCFSVGAVGENADEDVPYIELMDYIISPIDETMPGAFYVMGDYSYIGIFGGTLGEISAYGYEITYSYTGNRPTVTGTSFGNVSDNSFKSRYIDEANIGKIRGSFNGTVGMDFGISFYSSGCYVTVHSVRIFLVPDYQVHLSATVNGNEGSRDFIPGYVCTVSTVGYCSIYIDDWRNYDLISISANLGNYGITSVSARLIDNVEGFEYVIPFDMNYLNHSNPTNEEETARLTLTCDMRVVDPATAPDSTLIISINTAVPSGLYGHFQVFEVYGSILMSSPDKYLPWIKVIYSELISQGSDNYYYLSRLHSVLTNVGTYVLNGFEGLSTQLVQIRESLSLHYNQLYDFFLFNESNLLDSTSTNPLWKNIIQPLRDLVAGSPMDESTTNEMVSAGDQLADLGQQMAAGTPQVSTDFQLSVPEIPDDGSGMLATTMFSFFWGQDYIMKMLLTVVALATLSYVFFGKKG